MSEKGFYKKLLDKWFDDDKCQQRARENQFYEKANSEKVGAKPKSKPKDVPRADHKHDYQSVLIWKQQWDGKIGGSVGNRCTICGKKDKRFFPIRLYCYNVPEKYYGELEHFKEDEKGNLIPIDKKTYQKTIFLSGTETVNELFSEITSRLAEYMNCGYECLVGDRGGADIAMQKFFIENGYQNVSVYYSGDRPKVNLGGWKERHVLTYQKGKERERCKQKEEQMIADCDEAFMILRDEIYGTLENLERMYLAKKKCTVAIWQKHVYYICELYEEKDYIWLKDYLQRMDYRME